MCILNSPREKETPKGKYADHRQGILKGCLSVLEFD